METTKISKWKLWKRILFGYLPLVQLVLLFLFLVDIFTPTDYGLVPITGFAILILIQLNIISRIVLVLPPEQVKKMWEREYV
jgi:hypothetical protein